MAERKVGKRWSNALTVTDENGARRYNPTSFWKGLRSVVKYLRNRVAYGLDVTANGGGDKTGGTVNVSQGAVIQAGRYRSMTGAATVAISWSGASYPHTVIYIPSTTATLGNISQFSIATPAATLAGYVPTDAIVLAYVDTRTGIVGNNTGGTWGGSWTLVAGDINNDARPKLFESDVPWINWQ